MAYLYLEGKNQIEVGEIQAGDIGATSKLSHTQTGDTLCVKNNQILFDKIEYPQPTLYLAVEPKAKGDEDKIRTALQRINGRRPNLCC